MNFRELSRIEQAQAQRTREALAQSGSRQIVERIASHYASLATAAIQLHNASQVSCDRDLKNDESGVVFLLQRIRASHLEAFGVEPEWLDYLNEAEATQGHNNCCPSCRGASRHPDVACNRCGGIGIAKPLNAEEE